MAFEKGHPRGKSKSWTAILEMGSKTDDSERNDALEEEAVPLRATWNHNETGVLCVAVAEL